MFRNALAVIGGLVVLVLVVGVAAAFYFLSKVPDIGPKPTTWGSFPARPQVELLDDGRKLKLTAEFVYIDPTGTKWAAPVGWEVDGASIPEKLWVLTGSPLEGKYRNASIVHDYECDVRTKPCDEVHRMYYYACMCGGVDETWAKYHYTGVFNWGPKWAIVEEKKTITLPDGKQVTETVKVTRPIFMTAVPPTEKTVRSLKAYIDKHNPSLKELEKLDLSRLD